MGTATQQRAKSMSESYLNGGKSTIYSNDINMVKELGDYFGNKSNARQDQMYQRWLQDSKDWAERSAQVAEGTQRRNLIAQQNIAGIQGNAQVQSATASAAPGMYNAQSQRIGAIGQVSKAGATEFAKSLMNPFYKPNIQKMDEEAFNEKAEAAADKAFGRNSSGGGFVGGSGSGGGGSWTSSTGMNAPAPSGTYIDAYGRKRINLDYASEMAEYNNSQAAVAAQNANFARANAAGDIAIAEARAKSERELAALNQKNQLELFNKQAQESAANRASEERKAAMDAQSNMYSAMFSSFRSNPGDYQYWGGKV